MMPKTQKGFSIPRTGEHITKLSDDGGEYAAFLADRQSDAWSEFLMTGQPSALGKYLQADGEVDDNIRRILIDILLNGPSLNNRGGKNRWRDYNTYVKVCSMMASDKISKTEACRLYAKQKHQEQRAVEKQYEKGSKVFSDASDVFERAETNNEK